MTFIFCLSHLNIPSTIAAIENEQNNFCILSTERSIINFFADIYDSQNVFQLPETTLDFSRTWCLIKSLWKILQQKRKTLKKLLNFEPQKIFFFFVSQNEFETWLIKKFSKKENIRIFYKPEISIGTFKRSFKFRLWIKALIKICSYGIYFEPRILFGGQVYHCVNQKFFKKISARKIDLNFNNASVRKVLIKRYPEMIDIKIMVLLGGDVNCEISDYNWKSENLINGVVNSVGEKHVGIKAHPRFELPNIDYPRNVYFYPRAIPANILISHCSIIISVASATLFEAANLGKIAISLLDLIKPISRTKAREYKKYIIENAKNEIYFPESIIELNAIVASGLNC